MSYKMLDGNGAAVEAMKLADIKVISAYPITPQSSIAEKLSELVGLGEMDAEYIRVESEHTALTAATTAQLTGVRAATATASNGLALMHEVLGMTSGNRVPLVMPVVNRGVAAPWTLWCEHGDTMAQRDLGWMQFYAQNVQEVIDLQLTAYKIAEDKEVLLPAMVCLDGFFLSHSMQKVDVPDYKEVKEFLGEYEPKNAYLDINDPMFICDLTPPEEYTEMRYQQKVAMEDALDVIERIQVEYNKKFDRNLKIVESYKTDDADAVIVSLGSMSGTVKHVVNQMREEGKKVGAVKITVFRPFPEELIIEALENIPVIGVFDRSAGLGSNYGPVWNEISAVLDNQEIRSYIGGLGGRDVSEKTIRKMFEELLTVASGESSKHTQWVDTRDDAMTIREVTRNV